MSLRKRIKRLETRCDDLRTAGTKAWWQTDSLKRRLNTVDGELRQLRRRAAERCGAADKEAKRLAEAEVLLRKLCPHPVITPKGPKAYFDFSFVCNDCGETWRFGEGGLDDADPRFRKILEACGVLKPKKGRK